MSSTLIIGQARRDEWQAALELAYCVLPDEQRRFQVIHALHLIDEGAIDPAGIWVARWRDGLTGVQVAVPLGGASFLFWLPQARGGGEAAVEDMLVQAALRWCRQQRGKLAHAIVHPASVGRAAALLRNGFTKPTQLLYFGHMLKLPARPAATARFEPYSAANADIFRATLARSYEGTLDCPELNGVRTSDEILDGYRAAGPFDAGRWWLVRAGAEPAGVVILTAVPEGPVWDLSYLGIVPEYRRRGLARAATFQALSAARAAGVAELILAVDTRNLLARRLYESMGFAESELRDVYLCFIPSPPA